MAEEQNPVYLKWVEIANQIAKLGSRLKRTERRMNEFKELEKALRIALAVSGIAVPTLEDVEPSSRKRRSGETIEDLALSVTEPGQRVTASDVIGRLKEIGKLDESKHPDTSFRNAMRASLWFNRTSRGVFERLASQKSNASVTSDDEEDEVETAPPPNGGNGAVPF